MKSNIVFVCTECGKQLAKWMGRCPGCGEWNSVVEREVTVSKGGPARPSLQEEDRGAIISLAEVGSDRRPRMRTGINELDRVLGGGLIRRSVVLIGGDPGIGKSTLLMQAMAKMAAREGPVLYVSGEESAEQLKIRADRLGIRSEQFMVLVENQLETVLERMGEANATAVVLDSVQSVFSRALDSYAGSIGQIRHVAGSVLDTVKRGTSACFIVGHVTKDGALAGPKVLEHMVDTVLYFEGERGHPYRILRSAKNRFGSVSEIGVFEMSDSGLVEVANPSELFLSERPEGVSGSAVTALVEGSRPILAEIQALVSGPVPGQGRRTCLGTDSQRLALMIAVIEKKLGLVLNDHDVFLNAVGGVRATEPAADLALVSALISSYMDRTIQPGTLVFGEVGLAGEVRRASRADARINEAARLGFRRIILPKANVEANTAAQCAILGISHVKELASLIFA